MKLNKKIVVMFIILIQLFSAKIIYAEEVSKNYTDRDYAITPFSALMVLESLDKFSVLAGYSFKLAVICSDNDLGSIRSQLLKEYFRSTLEESGGMLIHTSAPLILEDSVEISNGVSKCFKILVQVAYVYELEHFETETYSVQRMLGIFEAFISVTDVFDDDMKEILTENAKMIRDSKSVLSRPLQYHLSLYLNALRRRQILLSVATSKQ